MRLYAHVEDEQTKSDILATGFGSTLINAETGEAFESPIYLCSDGQQRFKTVYPPWEGRRVPCPVIAVDVPDAELAGREVDATDTGMPGRHFAVPAAVVNRLLAMRN